MLVYLAIIACLLILNDTGGQPNRRAGEMMCFSVIGWASLNERQARIEE